MNGVSRTDEVDEEFRELSATLAPLSVDGFARLETIVSWLAPSAFAATETEWQSWFSSFAHDLDRPMVTE
eukprot:13296522-Alexandrium_andersonii.AAC.1